MIIYRAKVAGISRWEELKNLTEEELEGLLLPLRQGSSGFKKKHPFWQEVHTELKKTKGTTLYLFWKEYYENGIGVSGISGIEVRSCNTTQIVLYCFHGKTDENRVSWYSLSYNIQRKCKREDIS